ncbi:hypothetical protein CSB09_01640 [Candidatus Gracilibacteria bacterium]|nr:MAG: hypothetical protein CSB09_01640 [Candidatus Gracilibacteria bacterium]
MATIILAGDFGTSGVNEKRERFVIPLTNKNFYLSQIQKYITGYNRVVFIANDPANFEMNNERSYMHFQSLEMTGLRFKEKIILDNRNKKDYKTILENADLIFLSGGKLICQLEFFREISLKEFIKDYSGLIIGASAGAMTLCNYMTNFPEYLHEIDNRKTEDYIIEGLGLNDDIIIPHFDGKSFGKTYLNEGIDYMNDYILPLSVGRTLLGIPDGSYILLHDGKKEYFGDFFLIENKKITKVQK